jgi:hypothetical protein
MALEGKTAIAWRPIREGQEKGKIKLEIGADEIEYVITRRFNQTESGETTTALTVENAKGARYNKPQAILDNLLGSLSFDPLQFSRMAPAAQYDALKKFVSGFDLEASEKANAADFAARTDVNRRVKELRAQLSSITIPGAMPQRIDENELISDLEAAGRINTGRAQTFAQREEFRRATLALEADADKKLREARDLRERAQALEGQANKAIADAKGRRLEETQWGPLPEPIDTSDLRSKITAARSHNEEIDRAAAINRKAEELGVQLRTAEAMAAELTVAMDAREKQKMDAIAAAKFPVDGLSLGDRRVHLNGLPLDQASDAERLRASIAIAAAMNPELRLILVRDGSLLDKRSWKMLADFAEKADVQIIIETVDSSRPGAIVLEDGHIAGVMQQAAK